MQLVWLIKEALCHTKSRKNFFHVWDHLQGKQTTYLWKILNPTYLSSLRVAEKVCGEGLLIKSFPPESYKIKNIEDSWAFLATEGGQQNFEEYVREWMKNIYEVLLESEQLRLETDNAGPQEELEYWKSRAARLSLLVDQVSCDPCKLTVATLRVAQCKLVKVSSQFWFIITQFLHNFSQLGVTSKKKRV